jgi:hypothetical protein
MKKIVCIAFLVVIMLVGASSVMAASYDYSIFLRDTNEVSGIGDILYVDVMVEGEYNYTSFKADVTYDYKILQYIGYENFKGFSEFVAPVPPDKVLVQALPSRDMVVGEICLPADRAMTLRFRLVDDLDEISIYLSGLIVNPRAGVIGKTVGAPEDPLVIHGKKKVTVTFVDWDGQVLKTEQVKKGEAATAPTVGLVRDGHRFTGWDKDFSNVTENMTVTAQYEIDEYTITYILNGGENHADNTATYTIEDTPITLGEPTKAGYNFVEWQENGVTTTGIAKEIGRASCRERVSLCV